MYMYMYSYLSLDLLLAAGSLLVFSSEFLDTLMEALNLLIQFTFGTLHLFKLYLILIHLLLRVSQLYTLCV